MRKVKWFKYVEKKRENGTSFYEPEEQGIALFHQWGLDYNEFNDSLGTYSVGIIELPDGTMRTISVECIQFIDKPEMEVKDT